MKDKFTVTTISDSDSGNLTLSAIEQMREALKPVIYYGLNDQQERNVIFAVRPLIGLPFCVVHPDDLQMAINNTPDCVWKHVREMGLC